MTSLRVTNPVRGEAVLVERGWVADTAWLRVKGLLGRAGLEPGNGVLIEPCNSIHSMWMRFRFDALFLSRDGEVLHVIPAMKAWRISRVVFGAHAVLETPAGVAEATGTQKGDRLAIVRGT